MGHEALVYKGRLSCTKFSIEFSCVNPNTRFIHLSNTKDLSYASPPVWKQRPCGETTSEPYKPAFHGGHLSRNTSHGGAATLRIFRLLWWRYSYST